MATKVSTNQRKKESVVTDMLHKSSGSAVPDVQAPDAPFEPEGDEVWYVAILTHQKYTALCCEYIEQKYKEQGCTCYVPCKQERHVYANRTRRMVTKYIIPRLVFVTGITEDQAYYSVRDWPHVDLFMPDRAREKTRGHIALAQISHRDMVKLQNSIRGVRSADDITFTPDQLSFDEQIKVVSGELRGLEGGYLQAAGGDYLVFMLGKLGNIKVRVSISDCVLKKNNDVVY